MQHIVLSIMTDPKYWILLHNDSMEKFLAEEYYIIDSYVIITIYILSKQCTSE